MNKRVSDIIAEARKLSPEERQDLLDLLRIEFDAEPADGTPEEIEAAWVEEVERRIAAAERGETKSIPAEEVMAELRARLRRS